jgi:hypothetical protein
MANRWYERTLPAKYAKLLGRIVEQFASMELGLALHIQTLITLDLENVEDERALALVGGDDFSVLLAKLDRLFRYCVSDAKMLQEFRELRRRLETLGAARNKYIHAHFWDNARMPGHVHLHKFRRHIGKDPELTEFAAVTLEDLQSLIDDASDAAGKLAALIENNVPSIQKQLQHKLNQAKRKP